MLRDLILDWTERFHGVGFRDPLLLTAAQFNHVVAQEQLRAVRNPIPFCVLTIDLDLSRDRCRRTRKLIRILNLKLRSTDHKGILGAGRYGVVLVDTAEMGGRTVVDRLTDLARRQELMIKIRLQVHDPDGFGSPDDDEDDFSSPGREREWQQEVPVGTGRQSDLVEHHHQRRDQEHVALAHGNRAIEVTNIEPWASESKVRRFLRRSFDVAGASLGLLMTGPIVLAAMWLIRRHDGASSIFCQTREGMHGKPFTIYKLRTMEVEAEKKQAALRGQSHRDGPAFKITRDPRVTPIGNILRKTCIDELPQLWNVLKGDMSLVGPRPLPWHESRACQAWHRRRLNVRPGLTCYWQVNKGQVESFDDWMRLDLRYLSQASMTEDLKLIAQTVAVPVTGRGSE